MRLLYYTSGGELGWTKDLVGDDEVPSYAILSHTWDEGQEVTFDDLFCAQQAKHNNLHYFWIDTCCIDKSNNSELSEAIASMFPWYKNAMRCYVYLSNVSSRACEEDGKLHKERKRKPAIKRAGGLREAGRSKSSLLQHQLSCFTVDERMLWAQRRQTKREEDTAYSLLGIFNVCIPLLYGEGRERALHRVREEIRKHRSIDLPIATSTCFNSHNEEHNARCLSNTRTELLDKITTWSSCKGRGANQCSG
ncbi:HET domain containing protein [Pyrenophora teres f. teres]|uniref:HET domain containing protein n=1 Tax=Pyrenophora teres f. teres TaxID=97479 RepID=A0A6S6W2H3_9PLEO|nr:HET domain containing protein [Pyrenophora teres f. teres]